VKVGELVEMLMECDPDSEVLLMVQENWPFECGIAGLNFRDGFTETEEDEDGEKHPTGEEKYGEGMSGTDVFICQGSQLRYGSKRAWEGARRR
jgi:hypothetical protein